MIQIWALPSQPIFFSEYESKIRMRIFLEYD